MGKSLLDNDFSHAYLLIGTRGSGKTTTARLIAKIVNCTRRKKGEEPCNECESCKAVMEGNSLDTIEIDAASNTSVEDVRDLREKVRLSPVSSKYKVYIIDEVHMLSNAAFNALLKTLEEPPAHVIFVLATTDPQKIPETIISRCLVYDFGKATTLEIENSLKRKIKLEKLSIEASDVRKIAEMADGSYRDADKILEQYAKGEDVLNDHGVERIAKQILADWELKPLNDFVSEGGQAKGLIVVMIEILRRDLETKKDNVKLIEKLIEAYRLMRESPIPELPLEMVIVEQSPKDKIGETVVISKSKVSEKEREDTKSIVDWPTVIEAVKPLNHNLAALLKSSKPKETDDGKLIVEAFYKFHKDKLSEEKNRNILEGVLSGILGKETKVKFVMKDGDK